MGLLVAVQYAGCCVDLKLWEQILCATIFLIGGPFFAVAQILEAVLSAILPEGWDNDE